MPRENRKKNRRSGFTITMDRQLEGWIEELCDEWGLPRSHVIEELIKDSGYYKDAHKNK